MELDVSNDDKNKKLTKPRCRMKKLLNSVQEMLEFYFSDVNLNHDRFLRKEIENNAGGYIELSTMLKFNKLKLLTSDSSLLAKAVGNSSLLELNEAKDKVRRKEKLKELENTDVKTVYVEEFPLQIDHEWLKSVFSTCGKVEYVSLPKFKHNNQLKGFAFIEFSTAEEAQKACQVLSTIRSHSNKKQLSTDDEESLKKKNNRKRHSTSECDATCIPPNTSRRRRSISESSNGSSSKTMKKRRRNSHSASDDPSEYKEQIEKELLLSTSKEEKNGSTACITKDNNTVSVTASNNSPSKRKRKSSEVKELDIDKKKVTKEEPSTPKSEKDSGVPKIQISPAPGSENVDCKRKISTSDVEQFTLPLKKVKVENEEAEKPEEKDKKKKRNRQHKKKEKKTEKMTEHLSVPPLHVIPKNEWLSLKQEYKRLQRIKMSELKRNLKVLKSEQVRRAELKERITETISAKTGGMESHGVEQNPTMDEEKENHLDSTDRTTTESLADEKVETSTTTVAETKSKCLVMLPGTVVGLKTSSENLTRKDIKGALVAFGNVVYVDYVDGVYQGFVRFATSSDADNILSANSTDKQSWPFHLRKLTTDEENDYFRKAEEDRLKKYNKDQRKKRKKERGVDKGMDY